MLFHKGMQTLFRDAILRKPILLAALVTTCFATPIIDATDKPQATINQLVYIGTNTGAKSHGIYVFKQSAASGKLQPLGLAAAADNPGFLAIGPTLRYLYAVNEIGEYHGKKTGSVSAFAVNRKTGKLTLLNVVESGGSGPTHLAIDKTGTYVFVANYGAGSVAMFPVLADGRLGSARTVLPHTGHSVDPGRQMEPHAHSIYVSPDNRFVVSADLGTDQIYVYCFDASRGTLKPNDPPFASVTPGSGPRHFAFDRTGRFGYVIQEMASTITAFNYDAAHGRLTALPNRVDFARRFQGLQHLRGNFRSPQWQVSLRLESRA